MWLGRVATVASRADDPNRVIPPTCTQGTLTLGAAPYGLARASEPLERLCGRAAKVRASRLSPPMR